MNFVTPLYTIFDGAGNRYSNLKKAIYQIEKDLVVAGFDVESGLPTQNQEPNETTQLLSPGTQVAARTHANSTFLPALDKELDKISTFYYKKERELYAEVEAIVSDVQYIESVEHTFPVRVESSAGGHSRRSSVGTGSIKWAKARRSSRASRRSISGRTGSWSYDNESVLANLAEAQNATAAASRDPGGSTSEYAILPGHRTASPSEITPAPHTDTSHDRVDIENHEDGGNEEDDDGTRSLWSEPEMEENRIQFRHRIIEMFVNLSELQSYAKLNCTGFSKILKKYDKITNNNTKGVYMNQVVLQAYPFKQETAAKLQEQIDRVISIYARIFVDGDIGATKQTLRMHLREHMVWERNTIWKDMIGLERKSQSVAVSQSLDVERTPIYIKTPLGSIKLPMLLTRDALVMTLCCIVFTALLSIDLFEMPEQQNCFAILIFASILWATEAMPLFVTSLLVPLLVVMLRVMRSDDSDHSRLGSQAAAKKIFSLMFSPVIMLLLGGFAIAAAMSKFHIAKAMATVVLSRAGTHPNVMLIANMLVATFASMWISNVAAPVLCFSLIQPILRTLPPGSSFGKCLILGIALASNVGGMASPISSPQNIVAIEYMFPAPSWFEWFVVALPVSLVCDFAIAALLLWTYQPSINTPTLSTIRSTKDPITKTQVFVCGVTVITIILWCFEHRLEWLFGDTGLIAIIPLLAFFGTGILTKEDFNNFLWTVVILAMGGIALGKAVESSGLLQMITVQVQEYVQDMTVFQICCVFAALVLVVTTFISHTVGALIILPIVAEVGASLPEPHSRLLVMSSALMCSGAMGLPVSGFPNMTAIMMEDEMGLRYLNTVDFLKVGIPSSVLAFMTITTLGYVLMGTLGW
ncbi:low-affinity phosphate transporter [Mortierella sp. AD011]|nr:low-affinity phosphate transporter [Mortierella sp. AD010]KAF9403642.1 low-affinity phosphate transporter [Mortierella sp. AD011]